ncbi:MAG: hypothetical protein KF708_06130 [Pirellulales bacterium]|nr:hypothetical protein [Pirellulales bacterium]
MAPPRRRMPAHNSHLPRRLKQESLEVRRLLTADLPEVSFTTTEQGNSVGPSAVALHDGTDGAISDCSAENGLLDIARDETSQPVDATILDNVLAETSEELFLDLSFAGAANEPGTAKETIRTEDDSTPLDAATAHCALKLSSTPPE